MLLFLLFFTIIDFRYKDSTYMLHSREHTIPLHGI